MLGVSLCDKFDAYDFSVVPGVTVIFHLED